MTEVAPSMSQKGTTLMSFLVVLPPVLGQLWCLSWWFCLLPWDNSDRCGIFWLGWLMDVGRYEGVAPSMWAFAAWFWRTSWSCAIYVPKNDIFLQSSALVSPHVFSQHQAAFLGHRWRNSHSFAKIRLGMSHRWRNSLISPDIHQPT